MSSIVERIEDWAHKEWNRTFTPQKTCYQNYFEGYVDVKLPNKKGGCKLSRMYVSDYYIQKMTDKQWLIRKGSFAVVMLLAIAAFAVAQLHDIHSMSPFALVMSSLSLVGLCFVVTSVLLYLINPRKMTVYECKNVRKKILISTFLTFLSHEIAFVTMLYAAVMGGSLADWLSTAGYLSSGLCVLWLWSMENKTSYSQLANNTVIPFDPDADY